MGATIQGVGAELVGELGESRGQLRCQVAAEGPPQRDHALPQQRLRLVHAHGHGLAHAQPRQLVAQSGRVSPTATPSVQARPRACPTACSGRTEQDRAAGSNMHPHTGNCVNGLLWAHRAGPCCGEQHAPSYRQLREQTRTGRTTWAATRHKHPVVFGRRASFTGRPSYSRLRPCSYSAWPVSWIAPVRPCACQLR